MATFDPTKRYAFIDVDGLIHHIEGDQLVNKDTWNSGAFYDRYNVVGYQTALYVALQQVSIYPPTAIVDENWSSLVDITGQESSGLTLEQVYYIALSAGTTATVALETAWVGTYLGSQALAIIAAGSWLEDGTRVIHDWHMDWGTNSGQIGAAQVPYQPGGPYQTVGQALDALFYVTPSVTSFTNDIGTVEIGGTVTSILLNWAYNKTITSQSIDNGIGSLAAALRTYTQSGTYTTNRTYNLTASDGSNNATGSTSVLFRHKRYWGVSANTSLTDGQIIALSSEFATSRTQSRTMSPSGQYVYFAYPSSFGVATFTVNGLLNTDWSLTTRAFVNASGYSEPFHIYRSNNLLTGTYVIAIT